MELWVEGYAVTGMSSNAESLGEFDTDSMDEAVQTLLAQPSMVDSKSYFRRSDDGTWSFWGCRIFDNESDARRSFG